jgi:hypothetical protein
MAIAPVEIVVLLAMIGPVAAGIYLAVRLSRRG